MLTETSLSVSLRRGIRFSRKVSVPLSAVGDVGSRSGPREVVSSLPYYHRYDVGLVRPLNGWKADLDGSPEQYQVIRPLLERQSANAAHSFAEHYNRGVIVEEGDRPNSWALVFAPGALQELLDAA